jgi:uncharacterized membrane protein YfcA
MTVLATVVLGALIGLSLGALGGGGSILTVPALVYAVGQSVGAATTESLVIVGITSAVAAVGHARARHVRWGAGAAFGLSGIASSYAGTALGRHVNPDVLLLAFAVLVAVAATGMLRRASGRSRVVARAEPAVVAVPAPRGEPWTGPPPPSTGHLLGPLDGTGGTGGTGRTGKARKIGPNAAAKIIAAGLVVGFLTGFFGVGGGFVVVPALVMVSGYEMPVAVGTSLLVIAVNSAAALLARAGHDTFHWSVIVPFTLATVASSLAGKRIADKVSARTLTRAFVALLFVVAVYTAVRSGMALAK